jgi:hypothetical protein
MVSDESHHLILRMLADIRATQDTQGKRFDNEVTRFARIDKSLDAVQTQMTYAVGMASLASVRSERTELRLDAMDARQSRLDAELAEIRLKLRALSEGD